MDDDTERHAYNSAAVYAFCSAYSRGEIGYEEAARQGMADAERWRGRIKAIAKRHLSDGMSESDCRRFAIAVLEDCLKIMKEEL